MQERRQKHIFPDLIFSKFFVVFCLFVFIFILFGLAKGTLKSHKVNAEVDQLQTEINRLEAQNQDFDQLVKYLNTDTFIEQEAKLKLGLKKANENLVIIPDSEIPVKGAVNSEDIENKSNPAKWWAYFFN
jgi:cell division protein FtsB